MRVGNDSARSKRARATLTALGLSSLQSLTSSITAFPVQIVDTEVRGSGLRSTWREDFEAQRRPGFQVFEPRE